MPEWLRIIVKIVSISMWFVGPVLGIIGGRQFGLGVKKMGMRIDIDSTKPTSWAKGNAIGIVIALLGYLAFALIAPTIWSQIASEGFWINIAVQWLLLIAIGEFVAVRIANH